MLGLVIKMVLPRELRQVREMAMVVMWWITVIRVVIGVLYARTLR